MDYFFSTSILVFFSFYRSNYFGVKIDFFSFREEQLKDQEKKLNLTKDSLNFVNQKLEDSLKILVAKHEIIVLDLESTKEERDEANTANKSYKEKAIYYENERDSIFKLVKDSYVLNQEQIKTRKQKEQQLFLETYNKLNEYIGLVSRQQHNSNLIYDDSYWKVHDELKVLLSIAEDEITNNSIKSLLSGFDNLLKSTRSLSDFSC